MSVGCFDGSFSAKGRHDVFLRYKSWVEKKMSYEAKCVKVHTIIYINYIYYTHIFLYLLFIINLYVLVYTFQYIHLLLISLLLLDEL